MTETTQAPAKKKAAKKSPKKKSPKNKATKKKGGSGAGRPPGSSTKERPVVDHTPSPCPHCGATAKPTNLHNRRRIEGSGTTPDGRPYGAVELRNANCGDCGRPIIVRTHAFLT